eukprot:CAMPEP_0196693778 /NCGR_PEP_ID=MMETSP1090-20130531/31584_1 /TAXON_ID=37098 /ORGANISM="Isochrysis sp, Strain CCMP1244" /LENGTH=44 /DNA_ID= /DNA_START= /DNA_END= /DNA_ORIENTATION=
MNDGDSDAMDNAWRGASNSSALSRSTCCRSPPSAATPVLSFAAA